MQRILTSFLPLLILLSLASCRKTEEIVVPNNNAPPDATIDDVTVESYINRSYISLLGRKPTDAEFASGTTQLRLNNVSSANRETFLDAVMANSYYPTRLFDIGRSLYLNGQDTTAFQEQIFVFNLFLQDPQYQAFWPQFQAEIDRMQAVLDIPADYASNSIDVSGMHRRLVHNYIYDQINMGTQNFVVSMFQNFLFRYPTVAELEAGERMVDGFNATLFLRSGRTKAEFLDIFFASTDYQEGQVRDVYTRFLFREPTTEELETLTLQYESSGDYEGLLKVVLSSDEYAGL